MDAESEEDSQATQQATQALVDPRRLGKQNSGFTDEEIADIVCILYPKSENARREVALLARANSEHLIATAGAGESTNVDYFLENDPDRFELATSVSSDHAIVLRLSAETKDPAHGFTFGRHPNRCDFCFTNDPLKRLSNRHFRIFFNEFSVLMLEDTSTNGTFVDGVLLKNSRQDRHETMRTLSNGSSISVLLEIKANDLEFLVQIPTRHGEYEDAFRRNLVEYRHRIRDHEEDQTPTIRPGPEGPVDLFPRDQPHAPGQDSPVIPPDDYEELGERLPQEWNGSGRYNRVAQIGKGAFATVYKVTSKFDGKPYAAKELDKRRFMKNGVLDQKVDNEMNIMRRINHGNIVRYQDHFEWDNRLLIIIMEYIPMGDLNGYIHRHGRLAEKLAGGVAQQLSSALGYLHEMNITHRDVKPDNILIYSRDRFTVKLTDFGLSKMIESDETFLRTFCGTLLYCAPEVYSEYADYDEFGMRQPRRRNRLPPGAQRYDHSVDLWSLGGVLHYTLTGKPPFPVKSGTSPAELLHQIMTTTLNLEPLRQAQVSDQCIDCLLWMIHNRPESRATVKQVEGHPWLGGQGSVFKMAPPSRDESSDDLGQRASQLSLQDHQGHMAEGRHGVDPPSDDEIMDDSDDLLGMIDDAVDGSDETWSYKENQNPSQQHDHPAAMGGNRLFGEVNASAIGSSGAIPEDRLNLPEHDSYSSSAEYSGEQYESQIADLDMEYDSQIESQQDNPAALKSSMLLHYAAAETSRQTANAAGLSTASLGGAGSVLQARNVKSHAGSVLGRSNNDLTSSKRRKPPSQETSDDMDSSNSALSVRKPTFKRLRSEGAMTDNAREDDYALQGHSASEHGGEDASEFEDVTREEHVLVASVPRIAHLDSGRQMDSPVPKTAYWQANDRKTWHLNYPEMTQLQHDAFEAAALSRGEDFSPGRSPLWDLAMSHFPPSRAAVASQTGANGDAMSLNSTTAGGKRPFIDMPPPSARPEYGNSSRQQTPELVLPLAQTPASAASTALGDASLGGIIVPVAGGLPEKRVTASMQSSPDSVVQNVSVLVRETLTSFGRADENTQVHMPRTDVKVPKYAFKLLLWKSGFEPWRHFRPWDNTAPRLGPDASFHFYVSTKATNGIRVNDTWIKPRDRRNAGSAQCQQWVRLHDGDTLIIWGDDRTKQQAKLVFRCAWGGSSVPRGSSPPQIEPDDVGARLDDACTRAERKIPQLKQDDELNAAAAREYAERVRAVEVERRRSRAFENLRQEALRIVDGDDGRESAASAPPAPWDAANSPGTTPTTQRQHRHPVAQFIHGGAGLFPNRSASPDDALQRPVAVSSRPATVMAGFRRQT